MGSPNCRCNETDYVSMIQDRSCADCARGEGDGTCYCVAGDNAGYITEITEDYLCANWVKEI